jgi:hypothetical protein
LRRGRAGWRAVLCGALLCGFVLACGGGGAGGGSSDGGGSGEPPRATDPVDLPAGQTAVQLAWQPSAGNVTSYMVFLSRNHGSFDFDQIVESPAVTIEGVPNEEVRITVVAIGDAGQLSEASPPSVPIRFHAAAQVADNGPVGGSTGTVGPSGGTPATDPGTTVGDPTPTPHAALNPAPATDPTPIASDPTPPVASPPPDTTPDTTPAPDPQRLTPALRRRLLLADVRGPIGGLRAAGSAWIQSQLANEMTTGAALIATAERAGEAIRDLVWQDAAGQLFLSEGDVFAEAVDPAATLVETIRLVEGERFVELVDVDGDGVRDWIVEEIATGAAWQRSSDGTNARSIRSAELAESARLLGSGDLDGNGEPELVWQNDDRTLALAHPLSTAPLLAAGAIPPASTRIVAVADMTGDGLDDLVAQGENGSLSLGLTSIDPTNGGVRIEWTPGFDAADPGAELVATLDLDADGRAELAWLIGGVVEIRAPGESTPRTFEF